MRKIIAFVDAGMCETYAAIAMVVDDEATDSEIDKEVWDEAVQHAESYGDVLDEWPDDEDYDGNEIMMENISSSWEDYDAEKHDCQRSGGGSFELDFKILTG